MRLDGRNQIARPAVVQEEDPLAQSPQRRGAEFIRSRRALGNAVGEALAHVMHQQIGE